MEKPLARYENFPKKLGRKLGSATVLIQGGRFPMPGYTDCYHIPLDTQGNQKVFVPAKEIAQEISQMGRFLLRNGKICLQLVFPTGYNLARGERASSTTGAKMPISGQGTLIAIGYGHFSRTVGTQ